MDCSSKYYLLINRGWKIKTVAYNKNNYKTTYSIHEMACSVNNTDQTSAVSSRMDEATIFYLRKFTI